MCEEAGFDVRPQPLIWVKESGRLTDMDWKQMSAYETMLFMSKSPSRPLSKPTTDVFIYQRTPSAQRIHPMERPIALINDIIELSSVEGELIIDPFAGSFVVAEAALLSDRRYIGIEMEEEYYNKGRVRISGSLKAERESEGETATIN